ncbi:MAG: DNA-3-methyladenine glycosylase 2 family protein, partial [Flavitalea sp.]
ETLVHFILEQQVSLASALAALTRLREKLTLISVENILTLTDEEMRACYVSRQKMGYIRGMAKAIADGSLDLASLETMQDEDVKAKLVQLKGVGNWTAEVYMMFVLQRADIFPVGDIAAVNALKHLKHIEGKPAAEELLKYTEKWKPHRTIATMMLWHYYLENKLGSKKRKAM